MEANQPAKVQRLTSPPSPDRSKLVFRIGLVEHEERACFCLVKDVSRAGVLIKTFGVLHEGAAVGLRIGDNDAIAGNVAWVRPGLASIKFGKLISVETLMRVKQNAVTRRRRLAPRAGSDVRVCLRTGGSRYSATLCDIALQGARLRTQRTVRFGQTTIIEVPGVPNLKAYLRWTDGFDHGVRFETPLPMQIITAIVQDGELLQIW